MSANKKVVLIVILGVGACLLSFLLNHYFLKKDQTSQRILSRIQQATARVEHIQLLGRVFIQTADQTNWQQIMQDMESVRLNLDVSPLRAKQWRQEMNALNRSLDKYLRILTQLYEPAINLKEQKTALQGIGLSFSKEVEEKIIKPYQKEEGLRIYNGVSIDPFKIRVKDTAYDLIVLHIKQQLILLELLLGSDLEAYKQKKQEFLVALAKHKTQLRYMNILIGNEPLIQTVIESLNQKLTDLVRHEQVIIEYFTILSRLDGRLTVAGETLLAASRELSDKIVADTLHTSRLYRTLNWSLLLGLVIGLGLLGAMLARDIILFVQNLKLTQEGLKESENNLRVTLYSIGDAVIATDADGVITRMNPSAEQLTGWPSVEAMGKELPEVFHIVNAHTHQRIANPVEKILAKNDIVGLANDTILIAKNGTEYQIANSGAPIHHADGRIIGGVLVFRDITETRKLEERLMQSQKIESIGTLAGGVAHEINNPINGIMNYAQLIMDRMEKENPAREFAQEILHETERIAKIVRNLLTFARHEKQSHSPAQLSDIVTAVLSLIQTVMRRDQIDLHVEISEDLPKIKCRSQQIQQVLMNLMTNARDALNERYPGYDPGKRLRVSARSMLKAGKKFIRTTVEDFGTGIFPEVRERIFDPFFTTKPKEIGTGLGLSISYGIVKDHGGELIVESQPEQYTRFHMDLPVDNGWKLPEK